MSAPRAYLDWNATAPLRPEARRAMIAALDLVGNPSSVHAEGRAARAAIEAARRQVAALVGCDPDEVVFVGGATEAARMMLRGRPAVACAQVEHDAVRAEVMACPEAATIPVDRNGVVTRAAFDAAAARGAVALQTANSETGVIQPLADAAPILVADATQSAGKTPLSFRAMAAEAAILSAHKLGGPKGVGALILRAGATPDFGPSGGGQEGRRRPGTQNVPGIVGFGAAAQAARRDLEDGAWSRVAKLREILENRLEEVSPETIILGRGARRLPNTVCAATPGWKGETQVMALDLAGFAVSAGSACSSGKVGPSRGLIALGLTEDLAGCAIRASLGPTTTEAEVLSFVEAWDEQRRRRAARAA